MSEDNRPPEHTATIWKQELAEICEGRLSVGQTIMWFLCHAAQIVYRQGGNKRDYGQVASKAWALAVDVINEDTAAEENPQ